MKDCVEEIMNALEECAAETEKTIKSVVDTAARQALEKMKSNKKIPKDTGDYARGFFLKKKSKGTYYGYVLKNKKYRIAHLLEDGHITRNKKTKSRAFPHWIDAQKIADELPDKITEALKK